MKPLATGLLPVRTIRFRLICSDTSYTHSLPLILRGQEKSQQESTIFACRSIPASFVSGDTQ